MTQASDEREGVQVTALDHFVLRVRDLDRSLSFYRDLLGLPIEFLEDYQAGRRPFVSARVGSQLIDLVPDPTYDPQAGSAQGGLLHFCVRIAGRLVDDVLPRVRAQGIEILEEKPSPRMGATGVGAAIYVRDPDGYVVELKEEAPRC